MEDITFDFNFGIANEDGAWLPHSDQGEDYPGAGDYRDPYFMGFFAGITVETNDVIIDLNGKRLKQSFSFYYQQRWFSHIELANQPFMPAQGPGMFGANVIAAENIEIKNGIFDLTSHHAIHGNRNKNIKIHDIEICNFETHGIQLNGFDNVELYNIHIHSTSNIAYLKGEYGHARMLLPRLKKIYEENVEENGGVEGTRIEFPDRGYGSMVTMKDIYQEIEKEIDMAFDYAMNGVTYDDEKDNDDDEGRIWKDAKQNFIYMKEEMDDLNSDAVHTNSMGLPYGTAVYGIFLSFPGANVFSYGSSNLRSYNAKLRNIEIHGIRHKMHEYIRFHEAIPFNVNPFNAVFDVNVAVSNINDIENSDYAGNVMTDAYIAMNKMTDNFGYLQMQNLNNGKLVKWATNEKEGEEEEETLSLDDYSIKCNSDVMTHSGKGIIGIRMDGIENIELSNIEIYDMYDYTKLGSDICGEYEYGHGTGAGHFLQKTPMQTGFSGNMMQGISIVNSNVKLEDINIHDIGSATGVAYGIAIWKDNNINLNGDIINENIHAGFQLELEKEFNYHSRPNRAPEACGVMTYWSYGDDTSIISTNNEDSLNVINQCITGHIGCFDSDSYGASMLGTYQNCNDLDREKRALKPIYRKEMDDKLLELKNTGHLLPDFDSNHVELSFYQSRKIFTNENLDLSLSSSLTAENEENEKEDDSKGNTKNAGFYGMVSAPRMLTAAALAIATILGLIIVGMSYGIVKAWAETRGKRNDIVTEKVNKENKEINIDSISTQRYTSLSGMKEFDPTTLGYGAC